MGNNDYVEQSTTGMVENFTTTRYNRDFTKCQISKGKDPQCF